MGEGQISLVVSFSCAKPSTDHTLPTRPDPAWLKMAQSPLNNTTQPVNSEEEGRSPTTGRRWLIEKPSMYQMKQLGPEVYTQ